MRLWTFLLIRQVKKGQWMGLVPTVGFFIAGAVLQLSPYTWFGPAFLLFYILLLILGALLDKPFYERQMPALWKHLPASDAELDRIITAHDYQRMNDDMGEPYWPEAPGGTA